MATLSMSAVPPAPAKPHGGHDGADDSDASADTADTHGYVAHIVLDRTSLAVDGQDQALEPGMQVTAEIKTGRRRVISYLLSPLRRHAHDGGRER